MQGGFEEFRERERERERECVNCCGCGCFEIFKEKWNC